jgi:hypothetical protein
MGFILTQKLLLGYLFFLFLIGFSLLYFEHTLPLPEVSFSELISHPERFIEQTICFNASIISQQMYKNHSFFTFYQNKTILKGNYFYFSENIKHQEIFGIGKIQIQKNKPIIDISQLSTSNFKLCRR